MKTVKMFHEYWYNPDPARRYSIRYMAQKTYPRVPEYAVRAILKANAGEIIEQKRENDEPRSQP